MSAFSERSVAGCIPSPGLKWNTEKYDVIKRNRFHSPIVAPLSTFSIDVDTASYTNARRFLMQDERPPPDAIRTEEFINYFPYTFAAPVEGEPPIAVHLEAASAPWQPKHRLVQVGIRGRELDWEKRPANNLVFLLDVSGSMNTPNKLPLVKASLSYLVGHLDARDRVAIVVYAGSSGLVLPSSPADDTGAIADAIEGLGAGGSTNAGEGIELAYKVAAENLLKDGNNRVILCTDGDFNVGLTDRGELTRFVAEEAKKGIQLTILGYGMGNYKDDMLETLSNSGDGNYGYIDSRNEARKVFVEELTGSLFTIARDVKIQVEFNPTQVQAYRLIGYENRLLDAEDFNDDTKDAGEMGAGHSILALYEVVPPGVAFQMPDVDELRFQTTQTTDKGDELLVVKVRYKLPGEDESRLLSLPLKDGGKELKDASPDFRFAGAVAGFAMLLSEDPGVEGLTHDYVRSLASDSLTGYSDAHRRECVTLIDRAKAIADGRRK
ncbi:MAG: VWA domain-containing protein [Lentisphaerae bacterium]|nr:VWA domain-containing protein [Lentisphaerota bacterium]MBT4820960.1 VWA domain-containing protein [Lentisphaerota bacterium]MBT5612080.1 VWA domain-containing protein [Lentisphaerota bacterium]MBT7061877.1 VWA domain-containing protein [Lentisphaerota bacterium]MBT7846260.1 VWA domain-containing protein [Lentisphaerota bacterium]